MKKPTEAKEKIIEATIGLINESNGDIADVSTRAIAERAGTGIGMVNYHFQTKENLIEICVERIIEDVISEFNAPVPEQTPAARLKRTSKIVADFLMNNQAVSRISILSDMQNPKQNDNTMRSAKLIGGTLGNLNITDRERLFLSFTLTSIMQTLFLRKEQSGELFGCDMNNKEQRDGILEFLVDSLFGSLGDVINDNVYDGTD